jgi:hypothetical protein
VTFLELRGDDKERVRNPVTLIVPATRPVDPWGTPRSAGGELAADDVRPRRTVTLIRGATRTEVVFEAPQKPESNTAMTKTPVEE